MEASNSSVDAMEAPPTLAPTSVERRVCEESVLLECSDVDVAVAHGGQVNCAVVRGQVGGSCSLRSGSIHCRRGGRGDGTKTGFERCFLSW